MPEQMFVNEQNPGEAVSAVKALQKASQQGQRIYHVTQANQSAILSNIHHDQDTMDEIKNALNAGMEVMTHTDAVSVPGWSGAGYIITDPETGDGAYKISGGGNGGWLSLPENLAEILMYLANGDAASRSLRFLANFAVTLFGFLGDFLTFYIWMVVELEMQ